MIFSSTKVSLAVIISYSIFITIYCWSIISWFFVTGSMMNWSWSVVWGWSWSVVWGWGWVSNWYNNWMSYNWVSNYWGMDDGRSMMWLMDSMGNDWSMTMLDSRVAADISGGTSNKSRQCDKGLHVDLI